jgi:hypothetical protein
MSIENDNPLHDLPPSQQAQARLLDHHNTINREALDQVIREQHFEGEAASKFADMVTNTVMSRSQLWAKFMDPRRNIEDEFGYPRSIYSQNSEQYRYLFDSDGIANRVVTLYPKECWQVQPIIKETNDLKVITEFEQAVLDLGNKVQPEASWFRDETGSIIWDYMKRADIESRIGHFGVILLGLNDGMNLQEPVGGSGLRRSSIKGDAFRKEEMRPELMPKGTQVSPGPGSTTSSSTGAIPLRNGTLAHNTVVPSQDMASVPLRNPVRKKGKKARRAERNGAMHETPTPGSKQMGAPTDKEIAAAKQVAYMAPRFVANALSQVSLDVLCNSEFEIPGDIPCPQSITDAYMKTAPEGTVLREGEWPPPTISDIKDVYNKMFEGKPSRQMSSEVPPSGIPIGTDAQYVGVQFGPDVLPDKRTPGMELTFLRVFSESLVQIVQYESNILNPRFGRPVRYRITLNDPREQHSGVGLPLATVHVHWSRVIHLSDSGSNTSSSEIFSPPAMRPVLPHLLDARKVRGGSAEMYYRGAFPGISIETHPTLGGDVEIDRTSTRNMMEQYMNGLQRYLALTGMTAKSLAPQVVDPEKQISAQYQAIAIQLGVPMRKLLGSEKGQLASSQDDDDWLDKLRERHMNYLTPKLIVPFINRLIMLGVLPEPKEGYTVNWPDLTNQTAKEKALIAVGRTKAIAEYIASGMFILITPLNYFTNIIGMTEMEAKATLQDLDEGMMEQLKQGLIAKMTAPPAGAMGGGPSIAPFGNTGGGGSPIQHQLIPGIQPPPAAMGPTGSPYTDSRGPSLSDRSFSNIR